MKKILATIFVLIALLFNIPFPVPVAYAATGDATVEVLGGGGGGGVISGSGGGGGGNTGSTGHDFSSNAPIFQDPPIGLALLSTIPANPDRIKVEIQNQSVDFLQVWRDDGTGSQLSMIVLEPAGEIGRAGGGWVSTSFLGRVRIYGISGSQVCAFED